MFLPERVSVPVSAKKVPATALSRVDFPEPFVPIMRRKEPGSRRSETPRSARTSFGVPGLNVLVRLAISSMLEGGGLRSSGRFEFAEQSRGDERDKDEGRSDQLEIVWVQPPTQRN